jgi:nucleoside-diphosphate-sugar epimerase
MMRRAVVIGGTSAIGWATAHRLLAAGWQVELIGRDPGRMPADLTAAGVRFIQADRDDAASLRAGYADGADLLVDNVCYTAAQATALLPYARDAGSVVMLSSKAVYVDAAGHHSNSEIPPRFDGPITEKQPTMAPSNVDFNSREGYGANKVAAELVLLDSGLSVTLIRPSKVHGPGALSPREWIFVKRILDHRPAVLLANGGRGVDHTTAAANIAALIETVAAQPGQRILNSADPDAPSAADIARTIARHLGHRWDEVLLDDTAPAGLGWTPWDKPHPVVLDTTAATRLGYRPAGDYASTVAAAVDWLVATAAGRDGFDYAAEDAYLSGRGTSAGRR